MTEKSETPADQCPKATEWHRRPANFTGPCPICGLLKQRIGEHRSVDPSENLNALWLQRRKTADGWKETAIGSRRSDPTITTPEIQAAIAKVAALLAYGDTIPQAAEKLKVPAKRIDEWRRRHPDLWRFCRDQAEKNVVEIVKAIAGTDAVFKDPDAFVAMADRADRWAKKAGMDLFPPGSEPTLSTFFESFYRPMCLADARQGTINLYRGTLKKWRFATKDPPVAAITAETLVFFRDFCSKLRGIKSYTRATLATIAGEMRRIQCLLDKAGPPSRGNRDAAGLILTPPWIKPVRIQQKLQRVIPPEALKLLYDSTAGMDWPRVPGIKAPAWWKALLIVAYNTQLRRRTLFEMRMDEVDWEAGCLKLPACRFKAARPMVVHLNPAAPDALRSIRSNRELVFPRGSKSLSWFGTNFHKLLDSAGIPRKEHFMLHAIRKTAATVLAQHSPAAAQLALGHRSLSTTIDYYINPTSIISGAIDAMPQPWGGTLS